MTFYEVQADKKAITKQKQCIDRKNVAQHPQFKKSGSHL